MMDHRNLSGPVRYAIWGSELSPFALKIRLMFAYAKVPYRWLPADGGRLENLRCNIAIGLAKMHGTVLRYPAASRLDEYPLVPFVIDDDQRVYYDSSSIGRWLDHEHLTPGERLFPDDPVVEFVAQLIDEAFDEFGLYMLHHNRWVVSAADNNAGERLAGEFRRVMPPGVQRLFAQRFSRRQVRRLPYLFSVAASGTDRSDLVRERRPPARAGFPPTHALIEQAWFAYLDAIESILESQPYLLGERFTIADASAFAELGGNFIDPSARKRLQDRAPRTYAWLERMWSHPPSSVSNRLTLESSLTPLLRIILATFVPLMRQNEAAYEAAVAQGETHFNEPAFNEGRALYDGVLLGQSFRTVVKTFQVQVWRDLREKWVRLAEDQRAQFLTLCGAAEDLFPKVKVLSEIAKIFRDCY